MKQKNHQWTLRIPHELPGQAAAQKAEILGRKNGEAACNGQSPRLARLEESVAGWQRHNKLQAFSITDWVHDKQERNKTYLHMVFQVFQLALFVFVSNPLLMSHRWTLNPHNTHVN